MRIVIGVVVAALASSATAQMPKVAARCAPGADRAASATPMVARKLGDLPPASQIATVYRLDERGCPHPVVLRRGVGSNPERQVEPNGGRRLHPAR